MANCPHPSSIDFGSVRLRIKGCSSSERPSDLNERSVCSSSGGSSEDPIPIVFKRFLNLNPNTVRQPAILKAKDCASVLRIWTFVIQFQYWEKRLLARPVKFLTFGRANRGLGTPLGLSSEVLTRD